MLRLVLLILVCLGFQNLIANPIQIDDSKDSYTTAFHLKYLEDEKAELNWENIETEEIEKNTIKLSARMSNFANAIGMPMDRVKEEMRSLVSGNASTDSLISTIIFGSPGEANSAIREAEKKVNGVAELLDKKFKPFDILADTKTFDNTQKEILGQLYEEDETKH
jgi:hypothetical protein